MEVSDRGGTPPRRVKFLTPGAPAAASVPEAKRRVTFLPRDDRNAASPGPDTEEDDFPACSSDLTYQLRSGSRVRIITSRHACRSVLAHASESRNNGSEVGGILVGYHDTKQRADGTSDHLAVVTDTIPVRSEDSSQSHVAFDTECWNYVDQQMDAQYSQDGKCRLGWYHTHPTQGIFFSKHDRDAHSIFTQPYQFAMVVDPRTFEAGVFFWSNHTTRELGGPLSFSLTDERTELQPQSRFAISKPVRWDNVLVFTVAAALTAGSVVYRAFDSTSRIGVWDVCLLGCTGAIGLVCSKLGLFWGHAAASTADAPWLGRGFAAGAALVVLTFASGIRWPDAAPVEVASASRNGTNPIGGSGRAQFPAVQESRPGPADPTTATPPIQKVEKELRFDVSRLIRGRNMRVAVRSAELPAAVSYSVNCRSGARREKVNRCQILVDRRREREFVTALFGQQPRPSIQQFQRALGTRADGLWGPQTRARFVTRLVEQPRQPVHLNLPQFGPTILVFEPPARGRTRSTPA